MVKLVLGARKHDPGCIQVGFVMLCDRLSRVSAYLSAFLSYPALQYAVVMLPTLLHDVFMVRTLLCVVDMSVLQHRLEYRSKLDRWPKF